MRQTGGRGVGRDFDEIETGIAGALLGLVQFDHADLFVLFADQTDG